MSNDETFISKAPDGKIHLREVVCAECRSYDRTISRAAVVHALAIFEVGEKLSTRRINSYMSVRVDDVWISYTAPNLSIDGRPFTKWMMAESISLLNISRREVDEFL